MGTDIKGPTRKKEKATKWYGIVYIENISKAHLLFKECEDIAFTKYDVIYIYKLNLLDRTE